MSYTVKTSVLMTYTDRPEKAIECIWPGTGGSTASDWSGDVVSKCMVLVDELGETMLAASSDESGEIERTPETVVRSDVEASESVAGRLTCDLEDHSCGPGVATTRAGLRGVQLRMIESSPME